MTPTPRARARRGEGSRLREEIVAATNALLLETGDAEAVSIRAVAERVGVTAPSIYRHFEDKDALLYEVCQRHFGELEALMARAGSQATDARDELLIRSIAYVRFGLERPDLYNVMFTAKRGRTGDDKALFSNASLAHNSNLIRRSVSTSIDDERVQLLTLELWISVHGMVSCRLLFSDHDWPPLESMIESIVDRIVQG